MLKPRPMPSPNIFGREEGIKNLAEMLGSNAAALSRTSHKSLAASWRARMRMDGCSSENFFLLTASSAFCKGSG